MSGDKRKRELLEGIGWWDGGLGQAGRFRVGFKPLDFPLQSSSQVTVWESVLDV